MTTYTISAELLQELISNCMASIAEETISDARRVYRIELHHRANLAMRNLQPNTQEPTHYVDDHGLLYTAERVRFLGIAMGVMQPLYAHPVPRPNTQEPRWTITAPDGTMFYGDTPLRAASQASKYRLEIDPIAQEAFLETIEKIRQEGEDEARECRAKYGTLDCPSCGGSGHIADTHPAPQDIALRKAAQAVIDRWETPSWKDVPATAVYINELREALK